ncbi:MAG: metallophosphoesterase family protein [Chthoniobacteraceae bacterium]
MFPDVHGNLEALQAVLADMEALSVRKRVCLGDIVGYGANPAKCLQLIRALGCPVIKGNHDTAAAEDVDLSNMREVAQRGIEFTRSKLSAAQRGYLAGLPLTFSDAGGEFVHASLNEPGQWHYILREEEIRAHFATQKEHICFCGHTHVPVVWHISNSGNIKAWRGQGRIQLPEFGRILVNVGSVGQPRDLHSTACYAIWEEQDGWIEFRRVAYDIAKAKRKIIRAKLPRDLAERLSLGR